MAQRYNGLQKAEWQAIIDEMIAFSTEDEAVKEKSVKRRFQRYAKAIREGKRADPKAIPAPLRKWISNAVATSSGQTLTVTAPPTDEIGYQKGKTREVLPIHPETANAAKIEAIEFLENAVTSYKSDIDSLELLKVSAAIIARPMFIEITFNVRGDVLFVGSYDADGEVEEPYREDDDPKLELEEENEEEDDPKQDQDFVQNGEYLVEKDGYYLVFEQELRQIYSR